MKTTRISISRFLFPLLGIVMLSDAKASPELAYKTTGNQTLHALQKIRGKQVTSTVVGVAGFYGQDQPAQWLVLARDPKVRNLLHEYAMTNGKIVKERHFTADPEWDLPTIPIPLAKLKIDSPRAFAIAEANARKAGVGFDSVHYQLRCRDLRNEPVWVLKMVDQKQKSVGVQYISAVTGELLRSVWHRPGTQEYTQANEKKGLLDRIGKKIDNVGKSMAGKSNAKPQYRPTNVRPAPRQAPPRPPVNYTPQRRVVKPLPR